MELRDLMATLRYLARQSSVSRLRTAEMRINEYLGTDVPAWLSALECLRSAIESEAHPSEEPFWTVVREYVGSLLSKFSDEPSVDGN